MNINITNEATTDKTIFSVEDESGAIMTVSIDSSAKDKITTRVVLEVLVYNFKGE